MAFQIKANAGTLPAGRMRSCTLVGNKNPKPAADLERLARYSLITLQICIPLHPESVCGLAGLFVRTFWDVLRAVARLVTLHALRFRFYDVV